MYYRKRTEKTSLRAGKTQVFWANDEQHIPPGPTDIVQFWGKVADLKHVESIPNKLILSYIDYLYINIGFGYIWGNNFGRMTTWKKVYSIPLFPPAIKSDRILGAEATLWGEVSNEDTLDDYLWMRASCLGERLWNSNIKQDDVSLVKRLVKFKNQLNERGVKTSPVTVEMCEHKPELCFSSVN